MFSTLNLKSNEDVLAHHSPNAGNPDWSRVLIVEGTSGVGKSTLIDRLIRRYVDEQPARRLRTVLHLTQAHTYGPLAPDEDRRTLTVEQNVGHLESLVSLLEWYVKSLRAETKVKFLAIVDTLHLTQCHRPGVLEWTHVANFDQRLALMNVKLLFMHGSAETIWDRGIEPRRQEEFITGYALRKFGNSLEEVHQYFLSEQEQMNKLIARTRLNCMSIDVDDELDVNVDRAYKFWLG